MAIDLQLEGRDLTMRSCSRCDRRWWDSDGDETDLVELLGHAPLLQPALR